jgi:hypothetical protein
LSSRPRPATTTTDDHGVCAHRTQYGYPKKTG